MAQNWKQPRCPSVHEWLNKLIHPYLGILLSNKKEQIYSYTQQSTCTSRELWWVRKSNPPPKIPYTSHDSIHITLLKWQNYRNWEQIGGCQKLRRKCGWGWSGDGYKRVTCGILVVIKMFYILCQCIYLGGDSVLKFVKMLGKLVKGYINSLYTISYNCMQSTIISK